MKLRFPNRLARLPVYPGEFGGLSELKLFFVQKYFCVVLCKLRPELGCASFIQVVEGYYNKKTKKTAGRAPRLFFCGRKAVLPKEELRRVAFRFRKWVLEIASSIFMSLPDPLPDDPRKWEGWRSYNSPDYYQRLGLSYSEQPSNEIVEDSCRRLMIWWKKKLPLKNQPSNPLAQLLRTALDEAPMYLSEARSILLDDQARQEHDKHIFEGLRLGAIEEVRKVLDFALRDGQLREEDESRLYSYGEQYGVEKEAVLEVIEKALAETGAMRVAAVRVGGALQTPAPMNPTEEFTRLLRITKLDPDDITDTERDTFVAMAEGLGIDPADAEDLIDDFLDELEDAEANPPATSPKPPQSNVAPQTPIGRKTNRLPQLPRITNRVGPRMTTRIVHRTTRSMTKAVPKYDLTPEQERAKFPNFVNQTGCELLLVPSGSFTMGSVAPSAAPNEAPLTKVHVSRFYMARFPITNAQYEAYDPSHRSKRLASAGDNHPVVHVSSSEAMKFCEWLSSIEKRRFRLPTEAEWEYAARGLENRTFPWGEALGRGDLTNFADCNTAFDWSDRSINDGFAETAPVGSYPAGLSPFGIEDMAGNVWEWCLDFYESYKGGERVNPRGPISGVRRVYRGGSWRSRFASLRTTVRNSNLQSFSCNDLGFRLVCETDTASF